MKTQSFVPEMKPATASATFDYETMNATDLGILSARPGEHQAACIAEMKRRELEVRRAYWRNRSIGPSDVMVLGTFELSEAVTFGRITEEQREAELERRRKYNEWLKTSSWRQRTSPAGRR